VTAPLIIMIGFWFIRHPRNGANLSHRKVCGGFNVEHGGPTALIWGLTFVEQARALKKIAARGTQPSPPRGPFRKSKNDSVR
jgi:hypothetical protein